MRANRLLYGDRPIGVALRPHLLERKQIEALTRAAEAIAGALEKIAAAAVQSPALMTGLGLTETEQKLAMIDPGFESAGVTTRMDGFVYGEEIKFVEYNAENPSSLSDQEGLNRLLFDLPAMEIFAELDRLGYSNWIGCEYRPRGRTEEGLGWALPYGVGPRAN